jgi:hypothetical protein
VDDHKIIQQVLSTIPRIRSDVGVFVGFDTDGRALVDIGETERSRIPAVLQCPTPQLNENVWVRFENNTVFIVWPTTQRPVEGVITTTGEVTASVTTELGDFENLPYLATFTPASGMGVQLLWGPTGGVILGPLSDEQPVQVAPKPPTTGGGRHETVFTAIDSGSWKGRWWTQDVWYAEGNSVGAWWYGTKIKDTIPDHAVIETVEIFLTVTQASGSSPQIGFHRYTTRPDGPFQVENKQTLTHVGAGFTGWVQLSNIVGEFLKTNDGGIGTSGAGLRVFRGVGADPNQSGALRIRYTT